MCSSMFVLCPIFPCNVLHSVRVTHFSIPYFLSLYFSLYVTPFFAITISFCHSFTLSFIPFFPQQSLFLFPRLLTSQTSYIYLIVKFVTFFILFLSFQVTLHKLLLLIKLPKEKRYIYYIIKIKKDSFNKAKKSFSM